jgi:hypothetical protein
VNTAPPLKRLVPLRALFRCFPLTWKGFVAGNIAFATCNALIALSQIPPLAFVSVALQPVADWLARFVPAFHAIAPQLIYPGDEYMLVPMKAELAANMLLSTTVVVCLAITTRIDLGRDPDGVRNTVNDLFARTAQLPDEMAARYAIFSLVIFVGLCSGLAIRVHKLSLTLTIALDYIMFCGATIALAVAVTCAMIAHKNRIVADGQQAARKTLEGPPA